MELDIWWPFIGVLNTPFGLRFSSLGWYSTIQYSTVVQYTVLIPYVNGFPPQETAS